MELKDWKNRELEKLYINVFILEKVLYLRIKELSKKWIRTTKSNWSLILNELIEIFGERV